MLGVVLSLKKSYFCTYTQVRHNYATLHSRRVYLLGVVFQFNPLLSVGGIRQQGSPQGYIHACLSFLLLLLCSHCSPFPPLKFHSGTVFPVSYTCFCSPSKELGRKCIFLPFLIHLLVYVTVGMELFHFV